MKATELRIGNLLNDRHNRQVSVMDILSDYARLWLNDDWISEGYDFLKPIPLTEEWLLNFGFVKKEIGYSKLTSMEECFLISFGKHININGVKFNNEIKYVHQLQNLYFALTGEEITLNEQI